MFWPVSKKNFMRSLRSFDHFQKLAMTNPTMCWSVEYYININQYPEALTNFNCQNNSGIVLYMFWEFEKAEFG